jgi:nucleoside-diphosphate-sugar epimerase
MTRVLVLGGTGWLSGRIASAWASRGAEVTALARGGRPAPRGVRFVRGDRADPGAYDTVANEVWDEVVDVSSDLDHVVSALMALTRRAAHWTFVSTVSVYAQNDVIGADEAAPTVDPAGAGDVLDYPHAKAAAEAAVRSEMPGRALVVRPGLIVGPGDPSDRFGYWVSRFALAGSGPVVVPRAEGRLSQVIDVDDLADFVVRAAADGRTGEVNAVGDTMPLAGVLGAARQVADHTGDVVTVEDETLLARGIQFWMGPHSLPLWLPGEMTGFATRSNARFRAWGGTLRPLGETLTRTLADERARGLDRARRSGLTRAEELELLGAART